MRNGMCFECGAQVVPRASLPTNACKHRNGITIDGFCPNCGIRLDPPAKVRDSVVQAVRDDLLERSERGIAKYGTTLDRTDLDIRAWLQHSYEEALDMALYLKRAIREIDSNP